MNADLTLARLAEVAAAHDCHAHDGERHCLSDALEPGPDPKGGRAYLAYGQSVTCHAR
jgi:hypothetical protein